MEKNQKQELVNVSKSTQLEHPGSNKEEEEVREVNLASSSDSSWEEGLLRSSSDETEEVQKCDPMDITTREAQRKKSKKERKNEKRRGQRMEEREDRKGLRVTPQGDSAATSGTSLTSSESQDSKPGASIEQTSTQESSKQLPAKPRGPPARKTRREEKKEVKMESSIQPSASAAVREGEPGDPKEQPGTSTQPRGKRDRADKTTPPKRERKMSKLAAPKPSGGTSSFREARKEEKRENQVVILSNRVDCTITQEEAARLKENLYSEMVRTMKGPEGGPRGPELHFTDSYLKDPGWFLVTAQDETSMGWLLEGWKSLTEGEVTFTAYREEDAPYPENIEFSLTSKDVDLDKVMEMLDLQNSALEVLRWKHLETKKESRGWLLTFTVSQDMFRRLEEAGWILYYGLVTLKVQRMKTKRGVVRRARTAKGGAGPTEEGK